MTIGSFEFNLVSIYIYIYIYTYVYLYVHIVSCVRAGAAPACFASQEDVRAAPGNETKSVFTALCPDCKVSANRHIRGAPRAGMARVRARTCCAYVHANVHGVIHDGAHVCAGRRGDRCTCTYTCPAVFAGGAAA